PGKLDFPGLPGRRDLRSFENRAKARTDRLRLFEPAIERKKARVFLAFALRPDGQPHLSYKLAGGLGFEPRLAESESAVLPLDDPPPARERRAVPDDKMSGPARLRFYHTRRRLGSAGSRARFAAPPLLRLRRAQNFAGLRFAP